MKTFMKKLTYLLAAAAIFTMGAANLFAAEYEITDLNDEWYASGLMLENNEVEHFNEIRTGGADF
jgi:chromatin segregation and condensation protein Rec8/ScpA/Scc1 (kleisin family)